MKTDVNEIGPELLKDLLREFKASGKIWIRKRAKRKEKRKEKTTGLGGERKKRVAPGVFSTHPLCGSEHSISIGAIFLFLSLFLPPSFFFSLFFRLEEKAGNVPCSIIRFFEDKISRRRILSTEFFIDRTQQFVYFI